MLDKLRKEVDSVLDFEDLSQEIGEKEKVAGDMTDHQKKLYTLSVKLRKKMLGSIFKAIITGDRQTIKEAEEKSDRADSIQDIMWHDIKDEFDLWGHNIGVRKGFKIVIRD